MSSLSLTAACVALKNLMRFAGGRLVGSPFTHLIGGMCEMLGMSGLSVYGYNDGRSIQIYTQHTYMQAHLEFSADITAIMQLMHPEFPTDLTGCYFSNLISPHAGVYIDL